MTALLLLITLSAGAAPETEAPTGSTAHEHAVDTPEPSLQADADATAGDEVQPQHHVVLTPLPVPVQREHTATGLTQPLLPWLPHRGALDAFALFMLSLAAWGGGMLARRARESLAPRGLLPSLAIAAESIARILVVVFGLGVFAAIVPESLAPALPWLVLAGAVAIGWSLRDVLPDVTAGIVVMIERRVRPGQYIQGEGFAGAVATVGLRVTQIVDSSGRTIVVPNRYLLGKPLMTDRGRWPSVEVLVRVDPNLDSVAVRRAVKEAVLVSPFSAPTGGPDLIREEPEPGRWRVRTRLLDGVWAEQFEGALRETLADILQP
jgi:small-conductance mechanosensitive channel